MGADAYPGWDPNGFHPPGMDKESKWRKMIITNMEIGQILSLMIFKMTSVTGGKEKLSQILGRFYK